MGRIVTIALWRANNKPPVELVVANLDDVKKEKDYYCAVFQTRSELVLPIKYGGKIIGVFNSESEETNYYTKEMVEQLYKILENFSSRIIELGYVGNMNHGDIPYVHI